MKRLSTLGWINIILFGILISLCLIPPSDPDLFWHLQVGKDILSGNFPYTDSYSYSMTGYNWINHSWLLDTYMYGLYQIGGLLILALSMNFIFAIAILVTLRTGKLIIINTPSLNQYWESYTQNQKQFLQLLTALIFFLTAGMSLGARPQMITLLGLAITHHLLWRHHYHQKHIWWLLPIYAIWAQLHGGFSLGLTLILGWITLRFTQNVYNHRKLLSPNLKRLLVVFLACSLIPLINPYGWKIYLVIYQHLTAKNASIYIQEWLPLTTENSAGITYFIFTILLSWIIIIGRYQITNYWKIITPLSLLWATSAIRNIPPTIILLLPLILQILTYLYSSYQDLITTSFQKKTLSKKIWQTTIVSCFTIISLGLLSKNLYILLQATHSEEFNANQKNRKYPYQAIKYLQKNYPKDQEKRIFSEYGWGGYLIWYLPNSKTYIDGRMMVWEKNEKEILYTFIQYQNNIQPIDELFNQTDYILLQKNTSPLYYHLEKKDYPQLQVINESPNSILWQVLR